MIRTSILVEKERVAVEKVTLTIDNIKVEVPKDYTILQAAKSVGINIPTL
ncbi:MAG: ferredoxin, partial [Neobacillus sp.]|nr:ferredoxin [Neobacillus sp.]